MKIDWKKKYWLLKKTLFFIVGSWVFGIGFGGVLYHLTGDLLREMDVNEALRFKENPLIELIATCFRMYLVSYVLFYTLPAKIKHAKIWLRGIYFLLFYTFCWLIYLWI